MLDIKFKDSVKSKYKEIGNFHEGFAYVRNDKNLYGFINTEGKEVIPCIYKYAYSFHEGYAAVSNENYLYGFINKNGELAIPFEYTSASPFNEGLARVSIGKKKYFIDSDGNKKLEFDKDVWIWDDFHEGMAIIEQNYNTNNKYMSYIDKNGNRYGKYNYCTRFNEGLAKTITNSKIQTINKERKVISTNLNKDANISISSRQNNELTRVAFSGVYTYEDIQDDYFYGFMDNACQVVSSGFLTANDFSENLAIVRKKDGHLGFINTLGEFTSTPDYFTLDDFHEGFSVAVKNVGDEFYQGFIDSEGKEVIPCIYKYACSFHDGLAIVFDKNSTMHYINHFGEKVISIPYSYKSELYNDYNKCCTIYASNEKELLVKKLNLLKELKTEIDDVKDEIVLDNVKKLKKEK